VDQNITTNIHENLAYFSLGFRVISWSGFIWQQKRTRNQTKTLPSYSQSISLKEPSNLKELESDENYPKLVSDNRLLVHLCDECV
jgi:hypothetical protein